jgi:hypothetical protein
MKKTVFLFGCISLIFAFFSLFFISTGALAAEPIKMKIGISNEPGSPRVKGAELFGKLIKERTGGQVEVKVYPSIGMYTPPFGFNLFVSTSIFSAPMRKIVIGVMPFIAVSLLALFLTTYVPQISLWLPKLLYPKSFP